jgi:Methyltransferase domain
MRSQNSLTSVLRSKVQQLQSIWNKLSQDGRNLELVLRATSSHLSDMAPANDPLTYVKNLRNYIETLTFRTTTVERFDPMYSLAKERLHQRYGDSVSCHKGIIQEVLPGILDGMAKIDLVFHDASHTKEDYIRDFTLIEPYLASGCIVLIDDIVWDDPRFSEKIQKHTRAG